MWTASGKQDVPVGSIDSLPGIAHVLGMSDRGLRQLRDRRSDFPGPVADSHGSLFYDVSEIVEWYESSVG